MTRRRVPPALALATTGVLLLASCTAAPATLETETPTPTPTPITTSRPPTVLDDDVRPPVDDCVEALLDEVPGLRLLETSLVGGFEINGYCSAIFAIDPLPAPASAGGVLADAGYEQLYAQPDAFGGHEEGWVATSISAPYVSILFTLDADNGTLSYSAQIRG